jgi:hypothetical protein
LQQRLICQPRHFLFVPTFCFLQPRGCLLNISPGHHSSVGPVFAAQMHEHALVEMVTVETAALDNAATGREEKYGPVPEPAPGRPI